MTARVPVNPRTLVWARTILRLEPEDVARAANLAPERYLEIEAGGAEPTLRQARLIAKRLDRTLAFLLAPPPSEIDVAQTVDFRARATGSLPPALYKQIRRADAQRAAFLDLVDSVAEVVKPGAIDFDNVASRASEFRRAMGLRDGFRPSESQAGAVFNFWRGQLEAKGYLVFQTTGVDHDVFRGLSIYHDELPVILVNGADAANGKVFSLFHEVAHIANRTSGVCMLAESVAIEALANRFAANFLMPEAEVRAMRPSPDRRELIRNVAGEFRVSQYAAAIRLRSLDLIDEETLELFRIEAEADWARARQRLRDSEGFPPQWTLRTRDVGPTYLGAVVEALDSDRLTYLDATYLLNARLGVVEHMIADFRRSGGSGRE
ncbi:MAG: ImmA/IrrE family metallo-endopeptidase [Microbacteriaceae bacterium]|nr:MAG: ImmA/IrrE family metallo-endopeptidase [Microbacteriaceae bacterium]